MVSELCFNHPCLPLPLSIIFVVYLINRLPSSSINQEAPYQKLFKRLPDYKFLKVFGCACYPLLRPYNQNKLQPRSEECLFLGYSLSHKRYKCMAADENFYIALGGLYDVLKFPFPRLFGEPASDSSALAAASSQQTLTVLSAPPTAATPNTTVNHTTAAQVADDHSPAASTSEGVASVSDYVSQPDQETMATAVAPSQAALVRSHNTHPMCTRAKAVVVKPRLQPTLLLAHAEPKNTKSALSNPTWLAAMKNEYEALMKNGTRSLTDLPSNRSPVGSKWVFRVKENPDGTVSKYKARHAAKAFHQPLGYDYNETFSPVIKAGYCQNSSSPLLSLTSGVFNS